MLPLRLTLAALLAGAPACGRFGFDATGPAVDAAPAIDAPSDVASVCAHRFCDDLEDPLFTAWGGTDTDLGATVERDPARGFRGGSLKAVSPTGSALAALYVDAFDGVSAADQWVRLMLFVESGGTLDLEPVHVTDAARDREIVFAIYDTDTDVHAHGIANNVNESVTLTPPRDRWVCYELHVRFAITGVVELYRDGAMIVSRAIDTSPPTGTVLSRAYVGIPSKPTSLARTVWVDEVAVDTVRIGCP